MKIPRWQDVYDELCDEEGTCPFSSNKLMQDEIDALRKALAKMGEDFEATIEYMNEGCICGRAPAPVLPVDPRLNKPVRKSKP